jgi:LAGLIDADG endonuclease.
MPDVDEKILGSIAKKIKIKQIRQRTNDITIRHVRVKNYNGNTTKLFPLFHR